MSYGGAGNRRALPLLPRQAPRYALCMTTQIAVRLPDELVAGLDALVPLTHQTRSSLVRAAIESYVSRLLNERDAAIYERQPLSDAELAMSDEDRSWEATPPW